MPNHFHLLLRPERASNLSRFMQWLMTSHVRRYHSNNRTCGHVWQGRYKSFIVEEDVHLLAVVRYIEGNPVRATLVQSAREWRWSSHGERLHGCSGNLVDDLPLGLPLDWTEYVNAPMTDAEITRMRQSMCRGAPFGSLPWQRTICESLGLESTVRAKGRPRKWGQEK
jgi:putative transposase